MAIDPGTDTSFGTPGIDIFSGGKLKQAEPPNPDSCRACSLDKKRITNPLFSDRKLGGSNYSLATSIHDKIEITHPLKLQKTETSQRSIKLKKRHFMYYLQNGAFYIAARNFLILT